MIAYKQIQPPLALANYIKYFWVLDVFDKKENVKTINILVDKFPRLAFHCEGGVTNASTFEKVPKASICGVASRHESYIMDGRYSHIAACFYPNALKEIFGVDAHYAKDTFLDLHNFWPSDIIINVFEASTPEEKVKIISDFIVLQLRKKSLNHDGIVSHFLMHGYRENYSETLKDYKISQRQFVRRFKETIGITPMMFRRMCRFEESLVKLRTNDFHELIDIPYELGYSDQSHFNREFKLFTGLTPTKFLSLQRKVEESCSFLSE